MELRAHISECDFAIDSIGELGSRNLWPVINEISAGAVIRSNNPKRSTKRMVDELTGRIYTADIFNKVRAVYGLTDDMHDYCLNDAGIKLSAAAVRNYLRVPFRKIPLYEVNNTRDVEAVFRQFADRKNGYRYLWRGQTRLYETGRDKDELRLLYGDSRTFEPSFMPSFLRTGLSYSFVQALWNNIYEVLVHDLMVDFNSDDAHLTNFRDELLGYASSPSRQLIALAIAQHYGLPSVGLDLTDRHEVAAWFACNRIAVSASGEATVTPVLELENCSPTILVFRMPKNCIFEYREFRPKFFPRARPDCQGAWFAHVGWGQAKNQLGNYLCFAFKLSNEFIESMSSVSKHELFPRLEDDLILKQFVNLRRNPSFSKEVSDVLRGIYHFA